MRQHRLELQTRAGESLAGSLRVPAGASSAPAGRVPAVVFAPTAQADPAPGAFTSALRDALDQRGIASLEFGPAQAAGGASELRSRLLSRSLKDASEQLGEVLTELFEHRLEPRGHVDIRRLGVFGRGFGGAVAVTRAACDSRIGAVACVTPAVTTAALEAEHRELERQAALPRGFLEVDEANLAPPRELSRSVPVRGAPGPVDAAEALRRPLLIMAPVSADPALAEAARDLYFRAGDEAATLVEVEGCDASYAGAEARLAERLARFYAEAFGLVSAARQGDPPRAERSRPAASSDPHERPLSPSGDGPPPGMLF